MDTERLLKLIEQGKNDAERGLRQMGAGVAETFLASPNASGVGQLVPNSLWGLAGLLGSDAAAENFRAGVDNANKLMGTTDPENFGDTINRISLAAIMPGPKLPVPVSTAGRIGNTLAEILLPLNQTRSIAGTAASVGIPIAASETIHEVQQQYLGDDNYRSAIDFVRGGPPDVDSVLTGLFPEAQASQQVYERTPEPKSIDQIIPVNPSIDNILPIQSTTLKTNTTPQVNTIIDDAFNQVEKEKEGISLASAATGLALAGAIFGGAAAYRAANRAKLNQTTALHGSVPIDNNFSFGTMLKADTVDKNAPMMAAAEQSLKSSGANNVSDILDAMHNDIITSTAPSSIAAKSRDAAITGYMPGSAERGPKLAVLLESQAKLTPDQSKTIDEILTAKDKLQQIQREGATSWGNTSIQDLQNIIARQNADPTVSSIVEDYHRFYGTLRQYMKDAGLLSDDVKRAWDTTHSYYTPTAKNFESDPTLGLIKSFDGEVAASMENMLARNAVDDGVMAGEGIRPWQLHDTVLHHTIRAAENNRVRREFLDQLNQNTNQPFAKQVLSPKDSNVTIMRNGKQEFWRVDPILVETLKFKPADASRLWNTSRHIVQQLTTGKYRPDYIPTAVALEAGTAAFTRRSDMGLGLISEAMNRANVPKTVVDVFNKYVPVDPTMVAAPITGTLRGIYSDILRSASLSADVSLKTNGKLSQWIGQNNLSTIADTIGNAYANSYKRLLEQHGGGHAPLIENTLKREVSADLTDVIPAFAKATDTGIISRARANAFIRMYGMLSDNLHNSIRLQHAASNIRPGMSAADLTRVAGRTKELTGDVSQRGGQYGVAGKGVTAWLTKNMTEKIPYYNVAIQSMRATGRALKEHPVRFATTLAGIGWGGLELITNQSEDAKTQKIYWDDWTPEQRANSIPFFADDGSLITDIPVPQELRPFWSALVESYGTASGMKAGAYLPADVRGRVFSALKNVFNTEWSDEDKQDLKSGIGSAIGAIVPNPIPPIAGAALAATGVNPKQILPWQGRFGEGAGAIREERTTAEGEGRIADRIISNRAESAINELIGASAAPLINAADTAVRLYDRGYSTEATLRAAYKEFAAPAKDRLSIMGGNQIWDWEKKVLTQDTTSKLLEKKTTSLENLVKYVQQEQRNGSGAARPKAGVEDVGFFIPPSIQGTALGEVASAVKPLNDWIKTRYVPQVKALYNQLSALPANTAYASDPAARRTASNEIVKKIRAKNAEMYELVVDKEDEIGAVLGIPSFRLEDLDIDKLKEQPK